MTEMETVRSDEEEAPQDRPIRDGSSGIVAQLADVLAPRGANVTLAKCKLNFIDLLADADNCVIALSGKWGTGKSHLWKEVQATSTDDKVRDAVYVSLFGLSSIAELKLKVAQGVLPKLEAGGMLAESIKNSVVGAKKVLTSIFAGFSALDELALIAAPMMIKDRSSFRH
jgi:hypothetical protein